MKCEIHEQDLFLERGEFPGKVAEGVHACLESKIVLMIHARVRVVDPDAKEVINVAAVRWQQRFKERYGL
jgi:hypothetical protein